MARGESGHAIVGFNARTSKFDASKSSAQISVFDNADGTITKHVSQSAVNFKNSRGQWQQINTDLARTNGGALRAGANAFAVTFSGGAGAGPQAAGLTREDASSSVSPSDSATPIASDSASPTGSSSASDSASPSDSPSASPSESVGASSSTGDLASVDLSSSESFAWALQGAAQVTPSVSGDTATYTDILPDTTLQLSDQSWGVRELFMLDSAQAANSWTFPLSMTGVSLTQASDGTWELVDAAGDEVAYLDQPWAMDSNFDAVTGDSARTQNVSYSLATVNGVEQLTMTLDPAWLDDPSRVFPVTVDPTVTITDGESAGTETSTYVDTNCTTGVGCISNSSDYQLKVGNNAGTGDLARSFVDFPASDLVDKGEHVVSAQLAAFLFWTGNSTDLTSNSSGGSSLEVGPMGSAMPSGSLLWPGPSMVTNQGDAAWTSADGWSSAASCSDIPSTQSTNVNRWVYDDISSVSIFNAWQVGSSPYYGFFMAGVNDFNSSLTSGNSWKLFASAKDTSCAPYLSVTEETEQAPQVTSMSPSANASLSTLTPTLRATGSTADDWNPALTYDFTVFSGSTGKPLADSNFTSATSYTVKPGVLSWGQTYTWRVQVYDGDPYGGKSAVTYNPFSTVAPPPLLTDGLSQNSGGHGVDPSIGNYTTSATDAKVGGIGPALEIDRDYNSLDPRTSQALGAGWSSILDARATQVLDGDGNLLEVVFTYPDGSQVPFGANSGTSYAPPEGMYGTVGYSSSGGYTLTDKQDTIYTFGQNITPTGQTAQVWGLTAVTNPQTQALTLSYASGRVSELTGASGRHLVVGWQSALGTSATSLHVASIATDSLTGDGKNPLTWNYTYSGDELTSVCNPDQKCTDYGYESGSEYQNAVLDAAPTSYWPLDDPSGLVPAASAVLANEQADQGAYASVTMSNAGSGSIAPLEIGGGSPPSSGSGTNASGGPLVGSSETFANFNGSNSSLHLPNTSLVGQTYLTLSLWFNTKNPGPLWCEQNSALIATPTNAVCPLYVGADGHLHGGFYPGSNTNMTIGTTVDDGAWHQVVLEAGGSGQELYLDGGGTGKTATESGIANNLAMSSTNIGAGYNSGDWPSTPTSKGNWYYSGALSNVAYWTQALSGVEIANLYQIGVHASAMLTSITNPVQVALGSSGVPGVQVAYDTTSGRVMDVWDGQGEYQLSVPSVTGTSQVFRSAVLGSGPGWYWPLNDAAASSQATDQVNAGAGTYNNVTLGGAGEFPDATVGSFDGSSSDMQLPSGILDSQFNVSVGMWFNTSSTGEVLFSHSQTAVSPGSTTTANYQPWLYVGSDGKLVASIGVTGAITSSSPVNNGKWHYALLTASSSSDTLYLDGQQVGASTPHNDAANEDNIYVGTGYLGGSWPDEPNQGVSTVSPAYFKGSISDVALWRSTVDSQTANALYIAARNSKGVTPTETVYVADPGSTTATIPFDGTAYNASANHSWTSTNATMTFGSDGNLVINAIRPNATGTGTILVPIWSSGTSGNPNATLTFETSGDMVIANGSTLLWRSDSGDLNVTGILTAAGDFQLDSGMNRQIWHTNTNVAGAQGVDEYNYDPLNANRAVAHTDARGYTTTYGYDTQGFLNTVTDPNGNVTTTQHDVRGNLVAKTTCQNTAANKCSTQYWTYSPDDTSAQLSTASPANDQVVTYRNGNSSSSTDPTYETTYSYDNLGDQITVTTPPVTSESYANGTYTAASSKAGLTTTNQYTGEKLSDGTTITSADYTCNCGTVPNGLLTQSESPGGGITYYRYFTNGDLATVETPDHLITLYSYDAVGRVASKQQSWTEPVLGPELTTTSYTYDGEGHLATETDPQTADAVNTAATHKRHVVNTYDADGNLEQQDVSDLGAGGDATRTTKWTFTPYDQTQSVTDPFSHTTQYAYYPNGLKKSQIDPEGTETDYQYDQDGDLTATILENYSGTGISDDTTAGALTEESRSYDPADRLAAVTNAEGVVTAYTYYDNGLHATTTVEQGCIKTANGVACPSNPVSLQTESDTYDSAGNLTSKATDNGADVTDYTYDADNRMATTTVDPGGSAQQVTTDTYFLDSTVATSIQTAAGGTRETDYTYDPADYVLTSTLSGDETSRKTSYTRDPRGLATSVQDPNLIVTNYVYDELGRLTTTEQASVPYTTYNAATLTASTSSAIKESLVGYDTFGEQAETEDPDGNVTDYYYNPDGTISEILDAGGYTPVTPANSSAIPVKETRAYWPDGEVKSTTDADGNTTNYFYNQLGDQTSVQDPVNGSAKPTTTTYDKAGRETGQTTPGGTQTSTQYNPIGQTAYSKVYEAATGLINTTGYTYNSDGLLQQTTSPRGVTTSYTYDDIGETQTETDGASNTTTYAYDGYGDIAKTTYPNNTYTQDTYNALGEQTGSGTYTYGTICPAGGCVPAQQTSSTTTYDADGNKKTETEAINASQNQSASFDYYPTGQLEDEVQQVDQTASDAITISYGYDLAGNQTSYTDGNQQTTYSTYNSLGLPDTKTVPATPSATGSGQRNTYYVYDANGQLTGETQPGGVTETYAYDANGNVLTATGNGATATTTARAFGYTPDNQVASAQTCTAIANNKCSGTTLTSETFNYTSEGQLSTATGTGDGTSSFAYNSDNQLTSATTPASSTPTTYSYDGAGRLQTTTDPLTGSTDTYTYNNLDEVSQISYGTGGVLQAYGYDKLGQLTSDTLTNGSTTLGQIQYGYDEAGELVNKTDQTGTANTYTYDLAGRLTGWNTPTTDTSYVYDKDSNRKTITTTPASSSTATNTITNLYDNRDELTTSTNTPGTGTATTTNYTYNANGTLATSGANTATFDAYGQETSLGNDSYTYDALGRTVTQTTSTVGTGATSTTTDLAYVGTSNQVANDGNGNTYAYTPDGTLTAANAKGTAENVWTDQHTDVVGGFTPTGTSLLGTTQYDPLGNVLAQTGNTTNLSVGFQSGYTDKTAGQVNMDSRWYSPSSGQFTSADTITNPAVPNPANANPFGYADASPLTVIDPTGHYGVGPTSNPLLDAGLTGEEGDIGSGNIVDPVGWIVAVGSALLIQAGAAWWAYDIWNAAQNANAFSILSGDFSSIIQGLESYYGDLETFGGPQGPGSGGGGGGWLPNRTKTKTLIPICDAECQAILWLHKLQHDSGEGRTHITSPVTWINPTRSGTSAVGPKVSTATNDGGDKAEEQCKAAVEASAQGSTGSISSISDACFNGRDTCLSNPIPGSNPNGQIGGWDWYAPQGYGGRSQGAIGCAAHKNSAYNAATENYAGAATAAQMATFFNSKVNGCHLLPSVLGGTGAAENIAACWRKTNVGAGSMRQFETRAQRALQPEEAEALAYIAFPSYIDSRSRIPRGFYLSYIVWNTDGTIGGMSTYVANNGNGTLPNLGD